jgi:hypothetical protein
MTYNYCRIYINKFFTIKVDFEKKIELFDTGTWKGATIINLKKQRKAISGPSWRDEVDYLEALEKQV